MKVITYYFWGIIFLFSSCKQKEISQPTSISSQREEMLVPEKLGTNIDSLLLASPATKRNFNLANKQLKEFPDLSRFNIRHLDLSGNFITNITEAYLPQGLVKLDLSSNQLKSFILKKKGYNTLDIDLSKNQLSYAYFNYIPRRLNLSNNTLNSLNLIHFSDKRMSFLDVSNNPSFHPMVNFNPTLIDTIKQHNIKTQKTLVAQWQANKTGPIE